MFCFLVFYPFLFVLGLLWHNFYSQAPTKIKIYIPRKLINFPILKEISKNLAKNQHYRYSQNLLSIQRGVLGTLGVKP